MGDGGAADIRRRLEELQEMEGVTDKTRLKELAELLDDALENCERLESTGAQSFSAGKKPAMRAGTEMRLERGEEAIGDLQNEEEDLRAQCDQLEKDLYKKDDELADARKEADSLRDMLREAQQGQGEGGDAKSNIHDARVLNIAERMAHKAHERKLERDIDEEQAHEYELQQKVDKLERNSAFLEKRLQDLQTELNNEKQKNEGATWSVGWHAELQDDRARRKQRFNDHNDLINEHLEDHLADCWEDLQALKQLKELDPTCESLAAELDGEGCKSMVKSFAKKSFCATRRSFAKPRMSLVSEGGPIVSEVSQAGDFDQRKTKKKSAGPQEVELPSVQKKADQHVSIDVSSSSDDEEDKKKQKEVPQSSGSAKAPLLQDRAGEPQAVKQEEEEDDDDEEPELHPLLEAMGDSVITRKLLRALHLIELLQQQNEHLKDDVAHLEVQAAMWAKVERYLFISVGIMTTLILVFGIFLVMSSD